MIIEKRKTNALCMRNLFEHMGWFDRDKGQGAWVALSLEFNSAEGITAEQLRIAALYVEHFTDQDTLEGLDTADIMMLLCKECTTVFEIQGD